jgi:Kdo2-lipid IVA lauroyltransferase/acyltransferase
VRELLTEIYFSNFAVTLVKAIGYYIALPFLYFVSILPRFILYGVSDFFFVILYFVIGYRKKVVTQNLRKSFPAKSETEINILRRKFYRYFCDFVLETMKTLTVSPARMKKICRMTDETCKLFQAYAVKNQNVIIVMGHLGNWEWAGNTFALVHQHHLYVIYHPLHNKYFNQFIINMRTRFGTKLIPMKDTIREMIKNKNELNATAFIADQTPAPESAYWTSFLNQDTPIFYGTEKISRKLNYPVIYVSIKRVKRGYYDVHAETLCDEPAKTKEGEISELHTRRLEKDIYEIPETWLWSHRRWKHSRPSVN